MDSRLGGLIFSAFPIEDLLLCRASEVRSVFFRILRVSRFWISSVFGSKLSTSQGRETRFINVCVYGCFDLSELAG